MDIRALLKNFGLNDKETAVYVTLVELGPSPVRTIAAKSKVNRGTTYDILKALRDQGLVNFYNTKSHQYFNAEPPDKLLAALEEKQEALRQVQEDIEQNLPELKSVFEKQGGKPVVKLYEGIKGIKAILLDVLDTMAASAEKMYYVYSSATVRKDVYLAMPDFSKQRIKRGIKVKTIAFGEGGTVVGLDERKWMPLPGNKNPKATYEIMYAGKVAHISLDNAENPVGVVIQNQEIYETQKMIFEFTWKQI